MRWIIAGCIGALLVLFVLAADNDTSNYDAERTNQVRIMETERTNRETIQQAERTQRTAIGESAQTERTYISSQQLMWMATEREATLRLAILLIVVIVAATGAIAVAVLMLRRAPLLPIPDPPMPEPPPPHARRIVERLPGHSLEYDGYSWIIVLPNRTEYYTVEDAQRLIERR